jgi:hypothetical protein
MIANTCQNEKLLHGLLPVSLIEGVFGEACLLLNADHVKERKKIGSALRQS